MHQKRVPRLSIPSTLLTHNTDMALTVSGWLMKRWLCLDQDHKTLATLQAFDVKIPQINGIG